MCCGRTHPAETLYVFGANSGPITLMPTHMPEKISVFRLDFSEKCGMIKVEFNFTT